MNFKRNIVVIMISILSIVLLGCSSNIDNLNKEAIELIKVENYTKALEILNEALSLDNQDGTTWNNISLCYDAVGEYQLAVDAALKAVEFGDENEIEYTNLGNAYFDLGSIEEAKIAFEKALEFDEDYFYALYGLGIYYTEKEDYNKALEYFIGLYDNTTFDVRVVRYIAFNKYKQGELDQAIEFLERELDSVNDDELEQLLKLLYDFKNADKE